MSCICPGAVDTAMLRGGSRRRPGQGRVDHRRRHGAQPGRGRAHASIAAVREDRFLIFTHPEMQEYVNRKATDPDRWIHGMSRLWGRSQELLAD